MGQRSDHSNSVAHLEISLLGSSWSWLSWLGDDCCLERVLSWANDVCDLWELFEILISSLQDLIDLILGQSGNLLVFDKTVLSGSNHSNHIFPNLLNFITLLLLLWHGANHALKLSEGAVLLIKQLLIIEGSDSQLIIKEFDVSENTFLHAVLGWNLRFFFGFRFIWLNHFDLLDRNFNLMLFFKLWFWLWRFEILHALEIG